MSAGYSVVAVCGPFGVVNHILLFGNEVAHIQRVLQEELFFPFLSVVLLTNIPAMKRGVNFFPCRKGL